VDNNQLERAAIEAAMQRLLDGTPTRSNGSLTIVALAQEAGLRRNKLTHKHTDLRDRFRAEVARRDGVTEREVKLRDEIAALDAQLAQVKQERDTYRTTSETFARAMHVLTIENQTLRKEATNTWRANVVPLARPR
jgi:hypothetical protein